MRPRLPLSHSHSEATTGLAGFMPALNGASGMFLNGDGNWIGVSGAHMHPVATTGANGFLLALSGVTGEYMNGGGAWSAPAGDEVLDWLGL